MIRDETIYAVVRRIPRGRVATYGQVAQLAGLGKAARRVGYALSRLSEDTDVPWHRVINAQGRISERSEAGPDQLQRFLLEEEGVSFSLSGYCDLEVVRWRPRRLRAKGRRGERTS